MVRLRLKRFGRTHGPTYRLTAVDQRSKRDGRVIEELGWYDPTARNQDKQFSLNEDRVRYWLSVGAQPTRTAAGLIRKTGIEPRPGLKYEPAAKA